MTATVEQIAELPRPRLAARDVSWAPEMHAAYDARSVTSFTGA